MRRPHWYLFAAALLVSVSCDSDVLGVNDGEPNVTSMRLSVGSQVITINSSGTVTGGPIVVSAGTPVNVTGTFLTSEGEPDPNVTQASFQLNVTGGGVTFQRNNVDPFSGTLVAASAGNKVVSFALYNLEKQLTVFGPYDVSLVAN